MEAIFLNILNMSLTAGYCAGIVLCIRQLFIRHFPKVYSYILWLVVFARLALPFSYETIYSFVPIRSKTIPTNISVIHQMSAGNGQMHSAANELFSTPFINADVAAGGNRLQIAVCVAAWVWLAAAVGLVCYGIVSYNILKYKLKESVQTQGQIYESNKIPSPFVMGFIKPRIYLPAGLSGKEREYVLCHEQVHIKRCDYLVKQIAFLIVCVHWFNPMAWISLWFMCRDMELSCDEQVLKAFGRNSEQIMPYKKEYAAALLSLASGRNIRISSGLFFGDGNVKKRIQNVLGFQRPKRIITYISVILIILAAVGLMGNKKPDQPITVDEAAIMEEINLPYIYFIPEAYWAGIEGLADGEHAYPIILATEDVYDNGDGTMASMIADLYVLTEEGLIKLGEISSGGTAYPLSYSKAGIFMNSGHTGSRCTINTKTWELEIAESVAVSYDENGTDTFTYSLGDKTQESNEEEFLAFFDKYMPESVVVNFMENSNQYIYFNF